MTYAIRICRKLGLVIQNEVLYLGLEAILARMSGNVEVTRIPASSLAGTTAWEGLDLLIISVEEWEALASVQWLDEDDRPKIAVIGDELHTYEPSLFSTLVADGFLQVRDLTVGQLGDVIERIFSGEIPMPGEFSRFLLSGPRPLAVGPGDRRVMLTPRERETLGLLAKGLSNKQLARALGISMHGAKRLVAAVLLKLGVPNRTAAVVVAMKSGLVTDSPARDTVRSLAPGAGERLSMQPRPRPTGTGARSPELGRPRRSG